MTNYNQACLGRFPAEPVPNYRRVNVKTLVVILLSSLFLVACGQSESDIVANAKTSAEAYAQNLGAGAKVLSCSSQDSDNNGYVSCDLQKGDGTPVSVECSYKRGSSGCKAK